MPVRIEFSIARLKFVSATNSFWVCCLLRVCRQLAISIQAVKTLKDATNQNKPLPTKS